MHCATVTITRRHTRQCGDLLFRHGVQLQKIGRHGGGEHRFNLGDTAQQVVCVSTYRTVMYRLRKTSDLPWIYHDDWEAVGGECACEGHFKPPSGHEHNEHWEGIAAYCKPEKKIAMGFVEGVNNKIRVIQRRSYDLRGEECLRLNVLTCMLDPICNLAEITHSGRRGPVVFIWLIWLSGSFVQPKN